VSCLFYAFFTTQEDNTMSTHVTKKQRIAEPEPQAWLFGLLPTELNLEIFTWLPVSDIVRLCRTPLNRAFHACISANPFFWRMEMTLHWGDEYERFLPLAAESRQVPEELSTRGICIERKHALAIENRYECGRRAGWWRSTVAMRDAFRMLPDVDLVASAVTAALRRATFVHAQQLLIWVQPNTHVIVLETFAMQQAPMRMPRVQAVVPRDEFEYGENFDTFDYHVKNRPADTWSVMDIVAQMAARLPPNPSTGTQFAFEIELWMISFWGQWEDDYYDDDKGWQADGGHLVVEFDGTGPPSVDNEFSETFWRPAFRDLWRV